MNRWDGKPPEKLRLYRRLLLIGATIATTFSLFQFIIGIFVGYWIQSLSTAFGELALAAMLLWGAYSIRKIGELDK